MICLECYNDVTMIEFLGYTFYDDFIHSGTKSKVLSDLIKEDRGVGIVDQDYGEKHSILDNFQPHQNFQELTLLRHQDKPLYVIIIPQNLESWWERIGSQNKVDLKKVGILDTRGKIKKRFNSEFEKEKINNFLGKISPNQEFQKIKTWIEKFS